MWERVTEGRESLTISNTIALVRVAMEGPVASTKDSYNLSTSALNKWQGRHGERFTTVNWLPGSISETVYKIQQGKKKG